jgi:hypothetical protein
MKKLMGSFIVALAAVVLPVAAQERADITSKDVKKSPGKPPKAVYQHKTNQGHLGKFELNGEQGKADFYFNGQHHQDDLAFSRDAEMRDATLPGPTPGWVYQASSKGKKESLWFFFAAAPLGRGDLYAMYYSTTPPNKDGKQPWMRILTPGGTKRTSLDKKSKDAEEAIK